MSFEQDKKRQLEMQDHSSIGRWDEKIASLCNKINKRKEYYTTSSCAGRVVLIRQSESKKPGLFIFRSHDKISVASLKKEIKKAIENEKGLVYFRQEQCILHVACINLEKAQELLDKAKLVGWKNSGIMASSKRIVLEMRSTEHIELPFIDKGKLLVSDDYLQVLAREANKKLEKTWEKIKNLEKLI